MSEGETDCYLSQLVNDGYVIIGEDGGGDDGDMFYRGRCDSYYDDDGKMGVWRVYDGMVRPQGHSGREKWFADSAAAVSRLMMYGAPLDEAKMGDVLYENLVLSVLPFFRAVFRHVVREFDVARRCDEVKRSFSPLAVGLMDKICSYTSDSEIRDKGIWMEDGYYPVEVGKMSGDWESSQGLLFQGPYDVVDRGNGPEFRPSVVKATTILSDTGHWDFLMSTGVNHRPLPKVHYPLYYYGGYKGPQHKYYARKPGRYGVQKSFRGEEGVGMRRSLNLEDHYERVKVLRAEGYRGVGLVKKLEKELGVVGGVEFELPVVSPVKL